MPDREKVIKDLEFCVNGHFKVELSLATKTLALLKEQKGLMLALEQSNAVNGYLNAEVERLNGLLKEQETTRWKKISPAGIYECEKCGKHIISQDIECFKYCFNCGRSVK